MYHIVRYTYIDIHLFCQCCPLEEDDRTDDLSVLGSLSPPRSGSLERWDHHGLRGGWCFGTSTPGVFHKGFYNDLQIILSFSWKFEDAKLKNSVLELWNLPRLYHFSQSLARAIHPSWWSQIRRETSPRSSSTQQKPTNLGTLESKFMLTQADWTCDRDLPRRLVAWWCAFFWHGKLRVWFFSCFFVHFLVAGVSELYASEIQWVLQLGKMSACLWSDYQWHTNDKSQVPTSKLPDP